MTIKIEDIILMNKLKAFDINKKGIFENNEKTYEFEEIEREIITDNGSNQFIIFGLPTSLLYSFLITIVYLSTIKLLNHFKPLNNIKL